ncbi:MAG: hypothetical protein Q8N42_02220 [bacterium]|nr:hypothetical protein [bacterium]
MSPIVIKVDFQKDAWNWLNAISKKQSYGIDWQQFIPLMLKKKISNKNEKEVANLVNSFLNKKYYTGKNRLIVYANSLQKSLNNVADNVFTTMEIVTEKPIYRKYFTGFVTTFPRGPYSMKEGYVWFIYNKSDEWQIKAFIHELLHMQFEYYYKEALLKKINNEQFSFLKESMTVIINKEFAHIISEQDKGYAIHQEFRRYLLDLWEHRRGFSQFVNEAVKNIKKYRK